MELELKEKDTRIEKDFMAEILTFESDEEDTIEVWLYLEPDNYTNMRYWFPGVMVVYNGDPCVEEHGDYSIPFESLTNGQLSKHARSQLRRLINKTCMMFPDLERYKRSLPWWNL